MSLKTFQFAHLVRTPLAMRGPRASVIVGVMKSLSSARCLLPTVWGEVIVASSDDASFR